MMMEKRRATKKKASLKRTKTKLPPQFTDDLLLSCLARLSKLYYPTLSLVSKSFGSLVASPDLQKTRSSLGCTESCLYVGFQSDPLIPSYHPDTNLHWFTLCLKPGKKKSRGYALAPTAVPHSAPAQWLAFVQTDREVGSYYIGGPVEFMSSSRTTPEFWVELSKPTTKIIYDRKVYVTTYSEVDIWMEDFDPVTQIWGPMCDTIYTKLEHELVMGAKKVYMFGLPNPLVYKPKKGQWEMLWGWNMDVGSFSFGMIGNVLFRFQAGLLAWYETEQGCWQKLKGLEGFPKFERYDQVRLVDYGGKIVVLWEDYRSIIIDYEDKRMWCAVIALEKHSSFEILGKVEWWDMVLTIPRSFRFEYAFAATV